MKIVLLLLSLVLLVSCDCYQHIAGTVVDARTGNPIEGAVYYTTAKDWDRNMTDSTGWFQLSLISGMNCPPIHLKVLKDGYLPFEGKYRSSDSLRIQLQQK